MTPIQALLAYQQADEDGVMVLVSRQAIHEVADINAALLAALDGVLDEYSDLQSDVYGKSTVHPKTVCCEASDE